MKKKLFTLLTLLLCLCSGAWGAITAHDLSSSNFTKTFTTDDNGSISAGEEKFGMYFKAAGSVSSGKLNLPGSNINSSSNFISIPLTGIAKGKVISVVIAASAKMKLAVDEKTSYTANISSSLTEVALINSAITYNYTMTGDGGNAVLYFGRSGTSGTITSITIKVADPIENPVFTYATGTYYTGLVPTISCATEGATIYYKNADKSDRKDITTTSSEGSLGGAITSSKTFSAYALKDGVYSDIVQATYTIEDCPTSLTVDPAAGDYNSPQNVTFTSTLRPNGVIKYTTNGNSPSWSSTSYDGTPIAVSAPTTTIKARVFETTGSGNKKSSSDIVFTYNIVSLTDPVFSLSATSIPSNGSAQIKVGSNAGLDGLTLKNIAYGTAGVVTVSEAGVVTPVAAGTTTITFDTDATVKYNASSNNELTITVTTPKCTTPTITKGDFTFAEDGYKVTITNTQDGGTLKVSTDGETYTTQTSPYVTYATTTTHYYAKSEKASYDDSDVADLNVENTFDGEKKYIAWVYQSETYTDASVTYNLSDDGIYLALKNIYNVVPMPISKETAITEDHDIKNADLIVNAEAMGGSSNLAIGMKNFVGVTPMMNFKIWAYGASNDGNARWGWGKPANVDGSGIITLASTKYKILNGVTPDGGNINLFSGTTGRVQTVTWTTEPTNNVNMATNTNVAMHAIINNNHLDKQFFGFGVSCNYRTQYSENTKTIVKNAAAMLIAGTERLDAEASTAPVTVGANGYTTFACSYPLDLTDANRPAGLKAYKATRTGANLTFEKLNQTVPAGTGLLLLGETKGGTYNIPVAASGTAVENNALIGVTSPVAKQSVENTTYYFVMKKASAADEELKFAPITTAKAVTIPAGKAYIEVPNSELTSARELTFSFNEGNTTAINGIEEVAPVTKTRKVVKNGRLVIETANGEFTVSGARVK